MAEEQPKNPWPNFDVGELIKHFQIPGVDVGKLIESQRENIKALQEANQTALQGWQNLVTQQADMLREAFERWQAAAKETTAKPDEFAKLQFEHGRQAVEKALANMRELAELALKSQTDAADVIRKRFEAAMKELQQKR